MTYPGDIPVPAERPGLRVLPRRSDSWERLEVRDDDGVLLGRYDGVTGRVEIDVHERSLDVAAALAPYLLGGGQPFGEISERHLRAHDRLSAALVRAPFLWHRAVPLRGRLLFFYCPLAHMAVDIVDATVGEDDAHDPVLLREGVALVTVPLADIEDDVGTVTSRLNGLCVARSTEHVTPEQPATPRPRWRRWLDRMLAP